jgi:hypothetical protein
MDERFLEEKYAERYIGKNPGLPYKIEDRGIVLTNEDDLREKASKFVDYSFKFKELIEKFNIKVMHEYQGTTREVSYLVFYKEKLLQELREDQIKKIVE